MSTHTPSQADFSLYNDAKGVWHLTHQGSDYVGVIAVRAFPIHAPNEGVSILSQEGKELLWIDHLDSLPSELREVVETCIQNREFMPEILKLDSVNSFVTPCRWRIQTHKGATELLLKGEEDIRRLNSNTLIVSDAYGVQYLIKNLAGMDRHSRKLLDRFL